MPVTLRNAYNTLQGPWSSFGEYKKAVYQAGREQRIQEKVAISLRRAQTHPSYHGLYNRFKQVDGVAKPSR